MEKTPDYNGRIYECIQEGITGNSEPKWSITQNVEDGTVVWKPIKPDQLKVQFDNIAYSGLQKFNLDEEDSLCKIDIGGRMFLPLLLNDPDDEGSFGSDDYPYNFISYRENFVGRFLPRIR